MTFADRANAEAERRTLYTPEREHTWLFVDGAGWGRVDALADPTDEEVEDAALAMYWDAFCLSARNAGLHPDPWELLNEPTKESWRVCARAAIAAFLAVRRGSE